MQLSEAQKYLLLIYTLMQLLNTLISAVLWAQNRSRLYRSLFLIWFFGLVTFFLNAITAGDPFLLALVVFTSFMGMTMECVLIAGVIGFEIPLRIYLVNYAVGIILCLAAHSAGLGFFWYALPVGVCVAWPLFHASFLSIFVHGKNASLVVKMFAFTVFLWGCHFLDFPFMGNRPDLMILGVTLSLLLVFFQSIFAPQIVLETLTRTASDLDAQRRVLQKDLEVAGAVQNLLLPKETGFQKAGVSIQSYYQPAAQSGGDWWALDPREDGSVVVLVGDVTGHGAGSAMVTAVVASAYQTMNLTRTTGDLSDRVGNLHRTLRDFCDGAYWMTFCALQADSKKGTLRILSNGAPPVFLLRRDRTVDCVGSGGLPLGADVFQMREGEVAFASGERAMIFTDGAFEFRAQTGRGYGLARLRGLLIETATMPLERAREFIAGRLSELRVGALEDDLSFVLIDRI